ncbi:hypothetical protein [Streptomyces sp. WAC06614]|uniref:hypothetical protein n=1 Tax=Streptomyces sp. WAC06614 TaxID=2487416 RepID=UPI000F76C130|nr:hypothetical protein [Streptomyces sp. WAC06614]RSS83745.1 hypothetical protein EF918_02770 [Streptomyces sp. WAC06614]
MQWEDAIGVFAAKDQSTITRRDQVAGDAKAKWLGGHTVETKTQFASTAPYDVWWSYNYTQVVSGHGYPYSTVVGVNMNWGQFGDDSPLGLFVRQPLNVLTPLVSSPNQNDTTSVWSFDASARLLRDLDGWFTGWMPTIKAWAADVDAPDSDFRGSAAGAFKWVLNGFASELENLHVQLNTPRPYWEPIEQARPVLHDTHLALWNGYQAWRGDRLAWPVNCLHDAFMAIMQTAQVTVDPNPKGDPKVTISTSAGNPADQGFWDAVERDTRQMWVRHVQTALDAPAATAMGKLDKAYQAAIAALPDLTRPRMTAPPAPEPVKDGPGKGVGPDGKPLLGPDGKPLAGPDGAPLVGPGGKPLGGPGAGPDGAPGAGAASITPGAVGTGGKSPGALPSLTDPSVIPGGVSGGAGAGGGLPVLDGSGKPVLDPATGLPLVLPPGSTIGPGGAVTGRNGKPVLGADGKPRIVPEGSHLGTAQPGGGAFRVPEGSKVTPEGTVTGPDGKQVLDSRGNPVVLPKGATIGAGGVVSGPDGKPVDEQHQLLLDEERALLTPSAMIRPGTSSAGLSGPSGGFGGGAAAGADALPKATVPTVGGGSYLGTESGMGPRALDNGGRLTAEQTAAAAAAAAQQGQALQATAAAPGGVGAPMIPPSPGMGMGGGAPGQQERRRTTWLSEDEEVWGTESGATSGVIGR